MLSRHLYRIDEVRAALLWCIAKGRVVEGLFWGQEYLDSELYDEFFQTMFEGWLLFVGIARIDWLLQFWTAFSKPEVDADEMLHFLYTLLRIPKRDWSVEALLILAPSLNTCERLGPTPKTDAWIQTLSVSKEDAQKLRYIRLGKATSAWRLCCKDSLESVSILARHLACPPAFLEALSGMKAQYYEEDKDTQLTITCCLVGFLCLDEKRQKESLKPLPLSPYTSDCVEHLKEWKSLLGRRSRRAYSIPRDCLSWITSRGLHTYQKHTLREVRNITIHTLQEKGCPYWQRRLEEVNPFDDDDALMDFFDTEFPDDIPDEWSLADQKKSHGDGSLSLNETSNLGKLLFKWHHHSKSLLLWNQVKDWTSLATSWKEIPTWYSGYATRYAELDEPVVPKQARKVHYQRL